MNYCKLHRFFFIGVLSFLFAFSALAAESRLQLEARKIEMSGDYTGAIELYKKDMARKGKNATSLQGIARCYFAMGDFEQAEDFYAQLVEKDEKPAYNLAYAEVLLRNGKYETASQKAKEALTDEDFTEKATLLAAACDSAMLWESEQSSSYVVFNLDDVNTCYSDWGAQLYNPQKMIFISDRPMEDPNCDGARQHGASIAGGFTAQGAESDTAIIMEWSDVQMMPYPFNNKGVQVGPIVVAPDDSTTIYFTRTSGKGVTKSKKVGREVIREFIENLEIYSAQQTFEGWGNVTPFAYNNPKEYSVMHPCLSNDGKTLYFVSDMPGGSGGFDIWSCEQTSPGRWGRPENLGAPINTPGDEVFPTMGADGTLYFSSNGHRGMGGLDIFAAKKERSRWKPVRNLKTPFNSSADDFFYVTLGDSVGYFSSNRIGGKGGDDIYMFARYPLKQKQMIITEPEPAPVTPPEAPIDVTPQVEVDTVVMPEEVLVAAEESITLHGRMLDAQTKEPLSNVKICVTDSTKTSECKECSNDGVFNFGLKNNERYIISAFKQGYQSTIPIHLRANNDLQNEEKIIEMMPKENAEFQSAESVVDLDRIATAKNRLKLLPREYRIQVLTNWLKTDWSYFDELRQTYPGLDLMYTKRDRATRFTYGSFVRIADARRFLRQFIDLGYDDAFIAVFEYGKQVESIFSSGSSERVSTRRKTPPRY